MKPRLAAIVLAAALSSILPLPPARADDAPQVFLDKPAKIVAYQLRRLNNLQLLAIPRNATEPKYKPVYEAILTRKNMERKFRTEALEGLVKLNKSDPVTELLSAVGQIPEDDKSTAPDLIAMLLSQPRDVLSKQQHRIRELIDKSKPDIVNQAAYAALMIGWGDLAEVWAMAQEGEHDYQFRLAAIPLLPREYRSDNWKFIERDFANSPDPAAIAAVASMPGLETKAFKLLSDIVKKGEPVQSRDAAVRSLSRIPAAKWPKDQIAPLANSVVDLIKKTPGERGTTPALLQAVQLGADLAAALPPAEGAPIRKQLRELSVRVVVIHTLREQMLYDLRYFVVQADKPVQIVLDNGDAMPHNLVITQPGAMGEIDAAAAAVVPTGAENEKPFVPNSPKVLQATILVQPEESFTLAFNAPDKPGEYPFLCSFPGHAVRMYGVMLVVPDLDAWEAAPKPPTDPTTKTPMDKQKNEVTEGAAPHAHEHQ